METTILSPTQTHTPDDSIICETFSGNYALLCEKYAGSPVIVQVKPPHDNAWQNAVFAGKPIQLKEKGEAINLPIVPCFSFRLKTETAGAEVVAIADPD